MNLYLNLFSVPYSSLALIFEFLALTLPLCQVEVCCQVLLARFHGLPQ